MARGREEGTTVAVGDGMRSELGLGKPMEYVDHVAVVVRDADSALDYYVETLGLPLLHDERLEPLGVRLVYLDAGNTMLQLVEPFGEGAIRDFLERQGEGLHHICFGVGDIDAVLEDGTRAADGNIFQGGRNRRACFLSGCPNGLRVELTERDPRGDVVD